jgi:hypothetical protein
MIAQKGHYADPTTSKLRATVRAERNELVLRANSKDLKSLLEQAIPAQNN